MKKKTLISSLLIAATIVSSGVIANASGTARGGVMVSKTGSGTQSTVSMTADEFSIRCYTVAKFPGYSSYEKTSSVGYGQAKVTAVAPYGAYNGAYGIIAWSYNGPHQQAVYK